MHLTPEIFDSIDSFVERVRYVSQNTNKNDFKGNYQPDYTINSSIFDKTNPGFDYIVNAEYFEALAANCLCDYGYYKRIFSQRNLAIKPCHIYELVYHFYLQYLLTSIFIPLNIIISNIIKDISFNRILSEEIDIKDVNPFLSEWQIAEILCFIDNRRACALVSKLETESVHILELKNCILRKDIDGFAKCLINNSISIYILQTVCALIYVEEQCKFIVDAEHASINELEKNIKNHLEIPEIEFPLTISKLYYWTLHHPNVIPIDDMLSCVCTAEALKVQLVQQIKHYSTNLDAINEFDFLLKEHPEINDTRLSYDDFKNGYVYLIRFPILEDFKQRFVCDTLYPPSVGKAKEPKSCYRYNEDKCKWKEDAILYLYHRLVNHGFLEWSEETLYSFMYRMCPEYKPQRSDPSPIIWNGDISTLWTLIYHFHGESIKMDNLTRTFFLMQNGSTFSSTAGGKHYTNSKNPQIMEILQDPMFAKS